MSDALKRPLPSPEDIRQLLRYDPETGNFFWRERPRHFFASDRDADWWNGRFAGQQAFKATNSKGYKTGCVFSYTLLAHRVAWAIVHGEWPPEQIDHINCDGSDNRLKNLRCATRSQNQSNRRLSLRVNTSGFKGVTWSRAEKRWRAQIRADGRMFHLGAFDRAEDAHLAYCNAASELHGEYARAQ